MEHINLRSSKITHMSETAQLYSDSAVTSFQEASRWKSAEALTLPYPKQIAEKNASNLYVVLYDVHV